MKKKTLGAALRTVFGQDELFRKVVQREGGERSLLMSGHRMAILSFLTVRPCSSQRMTARAVGLSAPPARWHMGVLEHSGYLTSFAYGCSRRYFVNDMIRSSDCERFALLAEERAGNALRLLFGREWMRQGALRRVLGISQQAAALTMRRLEHYGLVEVRRDCKKTSYRASGELTAMMSIYAERARGFEERLLSLLRNDGVAPVLRRREGSLLVLEVDQGIERVEVRLGTDPLAFLDARSPARDYRAGVYP